MGGERGWSIYSPAPSFLNPKPLVSWPLLWLQLSPDPEQLHPLQLQVED